MANHNKDFSEVITNEIITIIKYATVFLITWVVSTIFLEYGLGQKVNIWVLTIVNNVVIGIFKYIMQRAWVFDAKNKEQKILEQIGECPKCGEEIKKVAFIGNKKLYHRCKK